MGDDKKRDTMIQAQPVERAAEPGSDMGESCLVLLSPAGLDIGRRTSLSEHNYVVGREPTTNIPINRNLVSRQHAQLSVDDAGLWWVQDMESTNGTFVNEERVVSRKLVDGDLVRFGDVIYKFLSGSNIERAYHEEIYRLTILDGLTGIHNKRYFLEFLEREISVASRYGHPLTLVMFDVDHFKKVNDTLGHLAGDAVLRDLSSRTRSRIRREDLFARYGGEEFVCVLPSTGLPGGVVFAESLRVLISGRPALFGGETIPFTISLGVATMEIDQQIDADTLIKWADEKLYEAKHGGRNSVAPSPADLPPE